MITFLLGHLLTILLLLVLAYIAVVHFHVVTKLQALEKTLLQKAEAEADIITGYVKTAVSSVHNSLSNQVAAVPVKTVAAAQSIADLKASAQVPVVDSLAAVEIKTGVAGTAHSA